MVDAPSTASRIRAPRSCVRRCRRPHAAATRSDQVLSSIGTPVGEARGARPALHIAGREHRLARLDRRRSLHEIDESARFGEHAAPGIVHRRVDEDRQHVVAQHVVVGIGAASGRHGAGEKIGDDGEPRSLVRADREQRAAVVEILGLDRRLPVLVDDPAGGTCSPLLSATISLPSATVDVVMSSITGSAPAAERRRRADWWTAADRSAEGRDAHRARRVEEVERHLPRRGGDLGPVAETSEVAAIAQADHRDARLRGLRDAEAGRELADDLAEPAVAIDDRQRVAVENDRRRGVRLEPSGSHPLEVLADAQHAMRIVPDEIGVDEALRDRSAPLRSPDPPASMIAATIATSFEAAIAFIG